MTTADIVPFARRGNGEAQTMSTREIAKLTQSSHDNVLKTVRRLIGEGLVSGNETTYVHPQNGQEYPEFLLDFRNTMVVASGYDPELRAKIIDHWIMLQTQVAKPGLPDFADPVAAARAWADEREARQIAERTKAEIGARREATAMNTASQAVKKASRLELELDKSRSYASVKRMSMLYHGQEFDWRMLKRTSIEMGILPIDVFDANYGTVKAYHADVWREAYALDIPAAGEAA